MRRADTTSDSFTMCVQVFINTREHGRNLAGDTGTCSPHCFRRGRHNMLCIWRGFKNEMMFVTFCVKSVSYPSYVDAEFFVVSLILLVYKF